MFHVMPFEQGKQDLPPQGANIESNNGRDAEDGPESTVDTKRNGVNLQSGASRGFGFSAVLAAWPLAGYALYRAWLSITQHERLLLDPASWNAEAMQIAHLATSAGLLLGALAIALSMRHSEKRLLDMRSLYLIAPLLFVVGTVLCAAAGNGWMESSVQAADQAVQDVTASRGLSLAVLTILMIGGLMAGVGSSFAFVMWGEMLCSLEHRLIRAAALAQLAIPGAFALLAPAPYAFNVLLFLLLPIGCFVCLGVLRNRVISGSIGIATSSSVVKRSRGIKPVGGLILGILVICAGYGFLQTTLTLGYGPGLRTDACTFLSFATAFVIAFAVFDRVDDPDHVRSVRIVVSMLVLGFLLYPLGTNIAIRFVSAVLVNCGFFLLEYLLVAALPELVSHVSTNPATVFGSTRVVVTGGVLAGMTVAYVFLAFVPEAHQNATACSIVTFVSVALLSWAGIWLLSPQNMHRFFWEEETPMDYPEVVGRSEGVCGFADADSVSRGSPSAVANKEGQPESGTFITDGSLSIRDDLDSEHKSHSSLERRCALLGARCGLTAREQEVLELWARGRSSPYIQETLVISANTVASHTKHIYQKIGVHSRQELLDELALVEE